MADSDDGVAGVLESKRNATRYRILVELAARQPAVSQQEIADAVGVTAQAVSDYLGDLVERGHVRKHGRGRYEVTKEGVDWLLSRTEGLREFLRYVTEDVVGQVEVDAAVATGAVEEGQRVTLSMRGGVLHATPGDGGGATAVAVTDAADGEDVGVTDFEGILEFEPGTVTVLSVPPIRDGGTDGVDPENVRALAEDADLVAASGTEALVAVRRAGREPDVRFGTATAVEEASTRGLDVLLAVTATELSTHTTKLREANVGYEVVEPDG